jgi:hypothetical protein
MSLVVKGAFEDTFSVNIDFGCSLICLVNSILKELHHLL